MTDLTTGPPQTQRTVEHPAKFSAPVLAAIHSILYRHHSRDGGEWNVLDPFAGIGGIHDLDGVQTWGVELEPEWAGVHERTATGSVLDLTPVHDRNPWLPRRYQAIVTSPCYGNRMADTYRGQNDTCTRCHGIGTISVSSIPQACPTCRGTGRASSRRYTYAAALGRTPSNGSAAVMQWGQQYRAFHALALETASEFLIGPELAVINISDHIRDGDEQGVHLWWATMMGSLGFTLIEQHPIDTRRNGNGANRNARVSVEWVLVFQR